MRPLSMRVPDFRFVVGPWEEEGRRGVGVGAAGAAVIVGVEVVVDWVRVRTSGECFMAEDQRERGEDH